jgi:hypothetical protein
MDVQQRTDDLKNKFQKASSPLEEILKNAPPGDRKVHANALLCLARATMTNYNITVQAYTAEHIQQIAWATRNLLELSVWTDYCAKSSNNANRFLTDALRDGMGIFRAMENLSSLATKNPRTLKNLAANKVMIDTAKRQLSDGAVKLGVSNLDHRYKKLGAVVKELGETQATAYNNAIALLSKFVHPTSLIVTMDLDSSWTKPMIDGFFEIALAFADGSLNEIASANL